VFVNESTNKLGRLEIQHIDIWYTHCPISQQRYSIVQIDKQKPRYRKMLHIITKSMKGRKGMHKEQATIM